MPQRESVSQAKDRDTLFGADGLGHDGVMGVEWTPPGHPAGGPIVN